MFILYKVNYVYLGHRSLNLTFENKKTQHLVCCTVVEVVDRKALHRYTGFKLFSLNNIFCGVTDRKKIVKKSEKAGVMSE